MISAAGSPACGGTLPRHLLWHRPVNGTWIRLGPWCRSSLDRRWVTLASPNPLLLCHTLPLSRLWLWRSERRRAGQERNKDGRPVCPQMSRSVFRRRNTWIEEAKVYFKETVGYYRCVRRQVMFLLWPLQLKKKQKQSWTAHLKRPRQLMKALLAL